MKFDKHDYSTIRQACQSRAEIEFQAPKKITAFAESEPPSEWTAYPPCLLPPEGYAQVFIQSGADLRGALTRLELVVHLDGGRVLYRKESEDSVGMKITWPKNV